MGYVEKHLESGEILDFYTWQIWRIMKLLHMWSKFNCLQNTDVFFAIYVWEKLFGEFSTKSVVIVFRKTSLQASNIWTVSAYFGLFSESHCEALAPWRLVIYLDGEESLPPLWKHFSNRWQDPIWPTFSLDSDRCKSSFDAWFHFWPFSFMFHWSI